MKTIDLHVSLSKMFTDDERQHVAHRLLSVDGIAHVRFPDSTHTGANLEVEYYPVMLDEVSVLKLIKQFDPQARPGA